jgi:hypothetical protein
MPVDKIPEGLYVSDHCRRTTVAVVLKKEHKNDVASELWRIIWLNRIYLFSRKPAVSTIESRIWSTSSNIGTTGPLFATTTWMRLRYDSQKSGSKLIRVRPPPIPSHDCLPDAPWVEWVQASAAFCRPGWSLQARDSLAT